jgi:hypothetical protein
MNLDEVLDPSNTTSGNLFIDLVRAWFQNLKLTEFSCLSGDWYVNMPLTTFQFVSVDVFDLLDDTGLCLGETCKSFGPGEENTQVPLGI